MLGGGEQQARRQGPQGPKGASKIIIAAAGGCSRLS